MRLLRNKMFGWRNFGIELSREPISYPTPHFLYTFTLHLWTEMISIEWEMAR